MTFCVPLVVLIEGAPSFTFRPFVALNRTLRSIEPGPADRPLLT